MRTPHHPRLGKPPLRRQGVGGGFGVFAGEADAVAEMGVGEFVGDQPFHERLGAMPQCALQHHRPAGAIFLRQAHRHLHDNARPGFIIAQVKPPESLIRSSRTPTGTTTQNHRHVPMHERIEPKRGQPQVDRIMHQGWHADVFPVRCRLNHVSQTIARQD